MRIEKTKHAYLQGELRSRVDKLSDLLLAEPVIPRKGPIAQISPEEMDDYYLDLDTFEAVPNYNCTIGTLSEIQLAIADLQSLLKTLGKLK
jgi:predicted DNA-binding protein